MKDSLSSTLTPTARVARPAFLSRVSRQLVLTQLRAFRQGEITLIDGETRQTFGKRSKDCPFAITLRVHDPRFYSEVAFGGDVGAGQAYMNGFWSCDDLTALVRILLRNRPVLDGMEKGWAWLAVPARKIFHWLHRNTRLGSRRNIAAHYDLSSEFFALFLDETMTYSCGIFAREDSTLQEASLTKIDRICRKLHLSPRDQVLEIGSGWGSFALHAARHYGCRVTTTTISQQQHDLAYQRVIAAGLGEHITVLLKDYRDLTGQYDKLVSIEMIEAVGYRFYDTYFRCCSNLLKPDGMMLLQAITIADQRYERAKRSVDFIQRYIFPGSCIPSLTAICQSLARATDLRLFHLEDQTPHYATTLRHWRERLFAHRAQVRALGYSDPFIRMWEYYLCYCEGGFHERAIGDVQMLLTKPLCRRAPLQPPLA